MRSDRVEKRALALEPLSKEELLFLYRKLPPNRLFSIANSIRFKRVPKRAVSWQIDRNINYTNICVSGCKFCNFHTTLANKERGYTTTIEEYREKIEELFKIGGDQLLLQGGLHPHYSIEFYEELFRALKEEWPRLKLNALGPPEVAHIAKLSKLSIEEALIRLRAAGLNSLPGAGAEILSERVRGLISPGKVSGEGWCRVMEVAHSLNIPTTATMVYGHLETLEERVDHLLKLREIQSKKREGAIGFTAFICWPMQSEGTKLSKLYTFERLSPIEHLKMIALSRIALNNIVHIQVSWLTIGSELAKLALHSGADDMGSIMIEENVVSSAGASYSLAKESMERTIREAGFEPWLRNQDYSPYNPHLEED